MSDNRLSILIALTEYPLDLESGYALAEAASSGKPEVKRAIVIYDSRYGNTEKIARSLERGLKASGVETLCSRDSQVFTDLLKEYDLIAVGGPTEFVSASRPMKDFLDKLKKANLGGKHGFAFDTKLDSRISGSAAGYIEKHLKHCGLEIIYPRASAIVLGGQKGEKGDVKLKQGDEERFEAIGREVGGLLIGRKMPQEGIPA